MMPEEPTRTGRVALRHALAVVLVLGPLASPLALRTAEAQRSADSTVCYQFDRAYFHWAEEVFVGDSALLEAGTIVRPSIEVNRDSVPQVVISKVLSDSSIVPWQIVYVDSAAVVLLSSQPRTRRRRIGAFPAGSHVLFPPAISDDAIARGWLRDFSYWRRLPGDSMEVAWRDGFHGPLFRLAVRGDTLRGRVRFTTDVVGGEPPPEDAWAVRVACPS